MMVKGALYTAASYYMVIKRTLMKGAWNGIQE
jgi:hypothetical protein